MLVVEESESSGPPLKQPRSDGPKQCAVSIQEIMRLAKTRYLKESK